MGRQPKRIETMQKKIKYLLWKVMNIEYVVNKDNENGITIEYIDNEVSCINPLNPKYHHKKLAQYESELNHKKLILINNLYENCIKEFMPIIEELQNDFTPKERIIILRMFDKN